MRHRPLASLRGCARAWIARYLPAELACTSVALACASLVAGAGAEAIAVAGTAGEVAAFYVVMLARELSQRRGGLAALPGVLRDLALEFGPAEALDSLLLRPALLYAGVLLAPHPALGAFAGKLGADVVFYSLAIASRGLAQRGARPGREAAASVVS